MPTTPGLLAIDIDDAKGYDEVQVPPEWTIMLMPRMHLSAKLNRLFEMFRDEPWYGVICDDQVPEMPRWDRILAAEAGTRHVAWADDCLSKRIGAAVYGGDLVREIGWLACPTVKHFYLDDVWETIVHDLHCGTFCNDVRIPHLHFSTGQTPYDRTYAERPSHEDDRIAFEKWKRDDWPMLRTRLGVAEHA